MTTRRTAAALLLGLVACGPTRTPEAARPAPAPAPAAQRATEWVSAERVGSVMGTSMKLVAHARPGELPDGALEEALLAAEAELRRIEDLMTSWRDSPLTRMNASAGSGPVAVPEELSRLVERSKKLAELTGGAFDPTWHALRPLWSFKDVAPSVPETSDVTAALAHVDWRRVAVDVEASTVELPEGFSLGLGGIAKGYGVDRAMAVLLEHGVENAMVDAGGDLKVLGRSKDRLWEVAIKHPRRREEVIALVPVSNTCVVTSGDYERFFVVDGVRYHHILDPQTGFPATGAMSATVLGPDAAACDALATAACVLGPDEGIPLIERIERFEALFVGLDGEVHATSGLKDLTSKR